MGLATLELKPGAGLGPFTVGMPLCEALAQVEQHPHVFGASLVKYSEQDPLAWDVVVTFPNLGFHLRFDPRSQRLRLVEVYDVTKVQLRYATSIFGGPSVAATFVRIYAALGPTFPGSFQIDRRLYTLYYPGLALAFSIPPQYVDSCQKRQTELPLDFPDGTTPVARRIRVYAGGSVRQLVGKAQPPLLPAGSTYMEEVQARLAEGLHFSVGGQTVLFGATPQDVWAELGRPCAICPKQVNAMVIHSAPDLTPGVALSGDYVYKYLTRGIDILFDCQTQRVKKFVLHTNFPGHAQFNTYVKCNFVLLCPPGSDGADVDPASIRHIGADAQWPQIQEILGDGGRAAIQTRGSVSNPFGPTLVYGFRHVALEMLKNGYIATATLFQAPPA